MLNESLAAWPPQKNAYLCHIFGILSIYGYKFKIIKHFNIRVNWSNGICYMQLCLCISIKYVIIMFCEDKTCGKQLIIMLEAARLIIKWFVA